jgi:cytidine deaminase
MKEFIEQRPTRAEIESFEITPERWQVALAYYKEHRDDLIKAAAFSRRHGFSHRTPPFKVGAAALAIEPGLEEGEYIVYQAYNFKPFPGEVKGNDKRCAERNALDFARSSAKVVAALVTVSNEVSTGDPTKAHDALHPCQECRGMLRKLLTEGLLREDTVVCNANDSEIKDGKGLKIEERTLKELLDLYHDDVLEK